MDFLRALFLAILAGHIVIAGCSDTKRISRLEAIEIAQREARLLGYKVEDMAKEADDDNSAWKSRLQFFEANDPDVLKKSPFPELLEKLRGQAYWAVRLSVRPPPDSDVFDGELWICVHARSGVIIEILR